MLFKAQTATLTIAQAFNLAFDRWKEKNKKGEEIHSGACEVCSCDCTLDAARISTLSENTSDNTAASRGEGQLVKSLETNSCPDTEHLLIDLSSPDGTLENKNCSWNIDDQSGQHQETATKFEG